MLTLQLSPHSHELHTMLYHAVKAGGDTCEEGEREQ